MRIFWKRAAAGLLALAMCLSFAGCYDENKTWAARRGDDVLPIGGYIYYLYSAYSEAANQVDSDTAVLDATIEDQEASEWILNRAMDYLRSYYYMDEKFDEYGLEITEEDQNEIDASTNSVWSYYQDTFETLGIAKESFDQAYTQYNLKYEKVMTAMYGEGGELEMPESEMETYFTDNYYDYEYFYASMSKTDEDGNSVELSDEERQDMLDQLNNYVEEINSGETTLETAANDFAYLMVRDSTYNAPGPSQPDSISQDLREAIESLDEGEAGLAESSSGYYVVRRLPIADAYETVVANENDRYTLLAAMKSEEFNDYVIEQSASLEGIELNQEAIDSIRLSSMVTDSNRNGTVSAASSTSSTTEESSSSQVSSEESSASSDAESSSSETSSMAEE